MTTFYRLVGITARRAFGRGGVGAGGRRGGARATVRFRPGDVGLESLEARALLSGTRASAAMLAGVAQEKSADPQSTVGRQIAPAVAVGTDGSAVVVWRRVIDLDAPADLANPPGIFAQRYGRGGQPVAGTITIDSGVVEYNDPSVALTPGGGFIVAYSQGIGVQDEVVVRRFDAYGRAQGGPIIFGQTDGQINDVRVATDPWGRSVIAWRDSVRDGGNAGIFAQRLRANGTALGSVFRVNTIRAGEQLQPSLSVDGHGDIVVAWKGPNPVQPAAGNEIFARVFRSNGKALGPEFVVNATSTGNQTHPAVAARPGGGFVVAWESPGQDGSGAGIVARRFSARGRALGGEIAVNTTTVGNQAMPAVTVDRRGEFVVAWQGNGPGDWMGIFGQKFRHDGRADGPQLRLNDRTDNLQVTPAVGMDGHGRLFAAWDSLQAVGTDYSVVTRSFRPTRGAALAQGAVSTELAPVIVSPAATTPGSVSFAIVGDFGYSSSDEDQNTFTAPEDYVAAMIRGWDPSFVISVGDDNYLLGRNSWFDRNVGKNYAPYIYPYVAQESYANGYPNGIPGTPAANYNRFFSVPGNHDYHDPFTSKYTPFNRRGSTLLYGPGYDSWFLPSLQGSPAVTPLAGSYVGSKPYSDSYASASEQTPYYDYLLKPIDASGNVLSGLANFYMIDGYQDVNGESGAGPNGAQAQAVLASAASRPGGAAWQFALSHYETYSSTKGGNLPGMDWNFAGSGIDVVVQGHVHNYERLLANGIPYFVNGTGGFNFPIDRTSPFTNPPLPTSQVRAIGFGAMQVTMSPTTLTMTEYFVDTTGSGPPVARQVDTLTLTKN